MSSNNNRNNQPDSSVSNIVYNNESLTVITLHKRNRMYYLVPRFNALFNDPQLLQFIGFINQNRIMNKPYDYSIISNHHTVCNTFANNIIDHNCFICKHFIDLIDINQQMHYIYKPTGDIYVDNTLTKYYVMNLSQL